MAASGKAQARKYSREIQHRLRVMSVIQRTMSSAHTQWWKRLKQQELHVRALEKEEKRLAVELKAMMKRGRGSNFLAAQCQEIHVPQATSTPLPAERVAPVERVVKSLGDKMAASLRQQPISPRRANRDNTAGDGFERFVAMSFEPTRTVAPGLTLDAWRVLAAREWEMKSESERSLYTDATLK